MKILNTKIFEKLKVRPAKRSFFGLKYDLRPFDIVQTFSGFYYMFFKGNECYKILDKALDKKNLIGRSGIILNDGMLYSKTYRKEFINLDAYDTDLYFHGNPSHNMSVTSVWHPNKFFSTNYLFEDCDENYGLFAGQNFLYNLIDGGMYCDVVSNKCAVQEKLKIRPVDINNLNAHDYETLVELDVNLLKNFDMVRTNNNEWFVIFRKDLNLSYITTDINNDLRILYNFFKRREPRINMFVHISNDRTSKVSWMNFNSFPKGNINIWDHDYDIAEVWRPTKLFIDQDADYSSDGLGEYVDKYEYIKIFNA